MDEQNLMQGKIWRLSNKTAWTYVFLTNWRHTIAYSVYIKKLIILNEPTSSALTERQEMRTSLTDNDEMRSSVKSSSSLLYSVSTDNESSRSCHNGFATMADYTAEEYSLCAITKERALSMQMPCIQPLCRALSMYRLGRNICNSCIQQHTVERSSI